MRDLISVLCVLRNSSNRFKILEPYRLSPLPVNPFAGKKIKSEMFFLAGSTGLTGSTGQPKEALDYF